MTRHRTLFIFLGLLLLILASVHLDDSMWSDEYLTMFYAGATPEFSTAPSTLDQTINRVAENRWQAPLYYILLWGWGHLAGWTSFAMGIPALFFGLITLAATYQLAKRLYSSQVAIYAALVLGLNGMFLHFLYEMRTYSLFMLLTVLMLVLYLQLLKNSKQQLNRLVLFTICVAALLYTHYFAVFPIAGLGLWHLLFSRKRPHYVSILVCFVIAGGLFLPWVQVVLGGIELTSGRSYKNLSGATVIGEILYFFSNGSPGLLLLLLGLALSRKTSYQSLLVAWLVFSFGIMWMVTRMVPALGEVRYVIYLWPALSILVSLGIATAAYRLSWWLILLWAVLFIGSIYSSEYQRRVHPWANPSFRELAAELMPLTQADDVVLFVPPPLEESVRNDMLRYHFYTDDILRASVIRDSFATSDAAFQQQLVRSSADAARVWLTYETALRNWRIGSVEDNILPEMGYAPCGVAVDNARIYAALFAKQPPHSSALSFTVTDDNAIDFYYLAPAQNLNNTLLVVNVGWYTPASVNPQQYSIGIHVDNDQNQLMIQSDIGIMNSGFDCSLQLLDVSGLPDGHYTIKTTIYNWQQGNRLPNVQELNAADGRVTLETVTIQR